MNNIKEIITYLIVGLLTTIASWVAAYICKCVLEPDIAIQNTIINAISWIVGVSVAYPMNRKLVFGSLNPNILREFLDFAASRISTLILDVLIMWLTVNILCFNYWFSKIIISTTVVMVTNYILSKTIVFKNNKSLDVD